MNIVFSILMYLILIYEVLIFIRVLLSWVSHNPYSPVIQVLYRVTDPVLRPVRRLIPPIGGTLDISPMVVLFALEILRRLVSSLRWG